MAIFIKRGRVSSKHPGLFHSWRLLLCISLFLAAGFGLTLLRASVAPAQPSEARFWLEPISFARTHYGAMTALPSGRTLAYRLHYAYPSGTKGTADLTYNLDTQSAIVGGAQIREDRGFRRPVWQEKRLMALSPEDAALRYLQGEGTSLQSLEDVFTSPTGSTDGLTMRPEVRSQYRVERKELPGGAIMETASPIR